MSKKKKSISKKKTPSKKRVLSKVKKKVSQSTKPKKQVGSKKKGPTSKKTSVKKKAQSTFKKKVVKRTASKKTSAKRNVAAKKKTVKKSAARRKPANRKAVKINNLAETPTTNDELFALLSDGIEDTSSSQNFKSYTPDLDQDIPVISTRRNEPVKKRKWWLYTLAALLVVILATPFALKLFAKISLPLTNGEVVLPGLAHKASISRDSLGVPFIEAESESDLFYATGYAQAGDRLWQMNAMKHLAQGRLSEIIGEKTLNLDHYMRLMGLKRYAKKAWKQTPKFLQKLFQRYADGVNDYVIAASALPPEFTISGSDFEKWTPLDSLSVYALLNFTLASNVIEELSFLTLSHQLKQKNLEFLYPIYPDEKLPLKETRKISKALQDTTKYWTSTFKQANEYMQQSLPASNNWAIAPKRTKNHKTIVANDTHLAMSMPSTWMLMHLKTKTYEAAGVLPAGIPFVALGYNGKIAWGATMVMADSQDIFIEKLKKKNGKLYYLFKKHWTPVYEIQETFKIKGQPSVIKTLQFTRHGPLLNDVIDQKPLTGLQPANVKLNYGIAHRWSMADGERASLGFYLMGKAKSMPDVKKALSKLDSIYLNVVYGDEKNIAWQTTGRYPRRKKGLGKLPSLGWTGEYEWLGYFPYKMNPNSSNPKSGFIATANHRTRRNNKLILSSSWYAPERSERAIELLRKNDSVTFGDMINMHMDQISLAFLKFQKIINARIDEFKKVDLTKENKSTLNKAITILQSFDGSMIASSAPAALYGVFLHTFTRNVFLDELGGDKSAAWSAFIALNKRSYSAPQDHLLIRATSPFFDDITTKDKVESKDEMIVKSLIDAYNFCLNKLGDDFEKWQWGDIHTYTWSHSFGKKSKLLRPYFSRGPYAAGGSSNTINVSGYQWGKDFNSYLIPAMRLIVDFSKDDPAYLVTHSGQSGNPASEHYDDMIDYFLTGKNNPLPFDETNIRTQYINVLNLIAKEKN